MGPRELNYEVCLEGSICTEVRSRSKAGCQFDSIGIARQHWTNRKDEDVVSLMETLVAAEGNEIC